MMQRARKVISDMLQRMCPWRRRLIALEQETQLQRSQLDGMNVALDKAEAEILRMAKGGKALFDENQRLQVQLVNALFDENQRLQVQLVNAHLEIGRLQLLPPNPGGDYGPGEIWC